MFLTASLFKNLISHVQLGLVTLDVQACACCCRAQAGNESTDFGVHGYFMAKTETLVLEPQNRAEISQSIRELRSRNGNM